MSETLGQKTEFEVFDRLLEEFKQAMRAKFILRKERYPGPQDITLNTFDWVGWPLGPVTEHLMKECVERIEAQGKGKLSKMSEDVDLANLAFLDYIMRKARGLSSS